MRLETEDKGIFKTFFSLICLVVASNPTCGTTNQTNPQHIEDREPNKYFWYAISTDIIFIFPIPS